MQLSEMKINAIAPWFGSKRGLAAAIVAQLGPHRGYWEPFCGSMSVLLAKPTCASETVSDLHGDLINLARVVRHPHTGAWLYRRLRRQLVHEEEYYAACERMKGRGAVGEGMDCDRAADYFVASWLGRNGLQGTKKVGVSFTRRYTLDGGHSGTRFAAAVDSIPAWRERLRKVTILRMNGFELLARIEDQPGQAIYCDPPYLEKGAEYQHDFSEMDHKTLAEALRRFKYARVVVSYFAHPLLEKLYPGWTQIDVGRAAALAHSGARGKSSAKAPELLLVNGEPYSATSAPQSLFSEG